MRRFAKHAAMIFALLLPVGCAASAEERLEQQDEISDELAQDLVRQLRARTDLRGLRLVVQPFRDNTAKQQTQVKRRRVYFGKGGSAPREFRDQLIDALAPRVRVVDATSGTQRHAEGDWGPATRDAILVGTYTAPDDDMLSFRGQVIDAETKTVLATVQRRWDS
jgi:hypothetical protein